MTYSLRNFLLVNLLLAIILITSLSALGDYLLTKNDIQYHMDALLEQVAVSFAAVTINNLNPHKLAVEEFDLDLIQDNAKYFFYTASRQEKNHFLIHGKYYFQLWNDHGKLLLYSDNANKLGLDNVPVGFSNISISGEMWRVYKLHDPQKHISFVVAERYQARNLLMNKIAQNNFYIMLLTYPISGLLIWFIVGWGLKSLRRVTNEVSNRAASYLKPVDAASAPLEVKPLIDELNKLFERLNDALEREKRFAADAAHELRTPLAALKTQAQVALKTTDENERQLLLENLISSVDRVVHIVQQLLTLSRLVPETESLYETTEINLPKLAAEIIAQLVPMAIDKKIEIELDTQDSSLYIQGNLTGISILIRNLVDNAIRYTPLEGYVKVEITDEEDAILLKVTDTGPGIPDELRSRVFERFYRVIGTTASGSGLGLAIVQQIAGLHRARIDLKTPENGRGLQIQVRFPKLPK